MKRSKEVFFDALKKSRAVMAVTAVIFAGAGGVFYLYRLPIEPFAYVAVIVVILELVAFAVFFESERKKAEKREHMRQSVLTEDALPQAYSLAEKDYGEVIRSLKEEMLAIKNEYDVQRQDEIDYYTAWVHQIKTPIAVMRMELGNGEQPENRRVFETELFRMEQYVDMVLQYIRLGGGSHDLVIREYALDDLVRETVRKFAPQFVAKRLRLSYDGVTGIVVTDKKWFSCILEQIVSNAIKYTQAGGEIGIVRKADSLVISDTGIGIAAEDVPRIFEKGFTGENGRIEKRSSGLGLYLCKKAADLLGVRLSVESKVGEGSAFAVEMKEMFKESL